MTENFEPPFANPDNFKPELEKLYTTEEIATELGLTEDELNSKLQCLGILYDVNQPSNTFVLPAFLEAVYIYAVDNKGELYMNEDADFHVEILGDTWELKYTTYPDEGQPVSSVYSMPKTIEEAIEQLYNNDYMHMKDGTLKEAIQKMVDWFPGNYRQAIASLK